MLRSHLDTIFNSHEASTLNKKQLPYLFYPGNSAGFRVLEGAINSDIEVYGPWASLQAISRPNIVFEANRQLHQLLTLVTYFLSYLFKQINQTKLINLK